MYHIDSREECFKNGKCSNLLLKLLEFENGGNATKNKT